MTSPLYQHHCESLARMLERLAHHHPGAAREDILEHVVILRRYRDGQGSIDEARDRVASLRIRAQQARSSADELTWRALVHAFETAVSRLTHDAWLPTLRMIKASAGAALAALALYDPGSDHYTQAAEVDCIALDLRLSRASLEAAFDEAERQVGSIRDALQRADAKLTELRSKLTSQEES